MGGAKKSSNDNQWFIFFNYAMYKREEHKSCFYLILFLSSCSALISSWMMMMMMQHFSRRASVLSDSVFWRKESFHSKFWGQAQWDIISKANMTGQDQSVCWDDCIGWRILHCRHHRHSTVFIKVHFIHIFRPVRIRSVGIFSLSVVAHVLFRCIICLHYSYITKGFKSKCCLGLPSFNILSQCLPILYIW